MENRALQLQSKLKSVRELMPYHFFIPSYQRGYRWGVKQVEELLEDIWSFALNPPERKDREDIPPFYCLQPLVVKASNDEGVWEVIDGQQRLTTIYLILKSLSDLIGSKQKNLASITYDTRGTSQIFLEELTEENIKSSIDAHYIYQANTKIETWFQEKAEETKYVAPKAVFANAFLTDTKVIWYQVSPDADSYDIFTRLNIGKIPLTNAELIKALFLKRWNNAESIDTLRLKQLQIASEWDRIENRLQENEFWYFIYDASAFGERTYINRIEYIFDLMMNRPMKSDSKYTFYEFYNRFEKEKRQSRNSIPDTDGLWLEIKRYFLIFEEWYQDRELYHLIGFLIATGYGIKRLLAPKDKANNKITSKRIFRRFLQEEISRTIFHTKRGEPITLQELEYDRNRKRIGNILLLFNIQTLLANEQSNLRFPFDLYKQEEWDIEHIRSQADQQISSNEGRVRWALDLLEYLTGATTEKEVEQALESGSALGVRANDIVADEQVNLIGELKMVAFGENSNRDHFETLYDRLRKKFKEDTEPAIHEISNLTLLDASTNRSYQNSYFPIKRQILLQKDMSGGFVPLCTKHVFMKVYSKKLDEMRYWNKNDAEAYLEAMEKVLRVYLPIARKEEKDETN